MKRLRISGLTAALVLFGATACADGPTAPETVDPALVKGGNARGDLTTIATVATDNGFNTLVALLQLTGLDAALDGQRVYTAFAPTEAAFAAIPQAILDVLLSPAQASAGYPILTDILLYHVTRGRRYSNSVVGARQIRMLNGDVVNPDASSLSLGTSSGGSAGLVGSAIDILASNGVVHVIDAVMIPQSALDDILEELNG